MSSFNRKAFLSVVTLRGRLGRLGSSSVLLATSNLCELLLPMTRGIALAHLLSPIEFGLAISITVVASIVELVSDLGLNQMALRSGTERTLPTLHSLAILRGTALAVVIAVAGPLFAYIFKAPGTAWVYILVGLCSFIRSLSHLEPKIRMRDYQYRPEALTIIGGQSIWTIVSIAAAMLLHDYRAMVVAVVVYSIGTAAISHLCSSAPYRLGWDKAMVSDSFRYGRPLTLNGVALAITGLGDRFLTGSRIGLEQLAQYTALATAAFTPRSVVIKFAISLFVPHFVNAQTEEDKRRLADVWVIILSGMGSLFAFCYIAVGQVVVASTFGKHYLIDQTSVSLIGILACVRYMATIPVAPSMANGRTSFVLLNTTLAASGLLLAFVLLIVYPELHIMIAAMIVGEGLGFLFVVGRLSRSIPMTASVMWTALLVPLAMLLLVAGLIEIYPSSGMIMRWSTCGIGIVTEFLLVLLLLRRSGTDISTLTHILFPKGGGVPSALADVPAS